MLHAGRLGERGEWINSNPEGRLTRPPFVGRLASVPSRRRSRVARNTTGPFAFTGEGERPRVLPEEVTITSRFVCDTRGTVR